MEEAIELLCSIGSDTVRPIQVVARSLKIQELSVTVIGVILRNRGLVTRLPAFNAFPVVGRQTRSFAVVVVTELYLPT